jgi:hypothetical protein
MASMRRVAAVAGAATLVKAGQALGVASSVGGAAYATTTCGTKAFVKFTAVLTPLPGNDGAPPSYGTVSLWYSATCRSVAAQVSTPNPVPDSKLVTGAQVHKDGRYPDDPSCFADVGSHGCKTAFGNDKDIQQSAVAFAANPNLYYFSGQTAAW